jgi:hypothetical protein
MPPLPSSYLYHYNEGSSEGNSPAPDLGEEEATGPPIVLACARCQQRLTTSGDRVARAGAHAHTFTNPEGLRFRIGCFKAAAGTTTASAPTEYWSWFPGYAWQVEQCAACGAHLGWLFTASSDHFHGFILDRLVELPE